MRVSPKKLERPAIFSFYDRSSWYPGRRHFDLCFVYEVHNPGPREIPPWWQRLEFVDMRFLRKQELGSAMSDLVRDLRL